MYVGCSAGGMPQQRDLNALGALAKGLGAGEQADVAARRSDYAITIGDHRGALTAAQQAVKWGQQGQRPGAEVCGYLNWGTALVALESIPAGRDRCAEALALARSYGLHDLEALALAYLGDLGDDVPKEIGYNEEALRSARQIGDRQAELRALEMLSVCDLQLGDLARAWTGLEQALSLSREIGARYRESTVLWSLGQYCYAVGDYGRARAYYDLALHIAAEIQNRPFTVYALFKRADAAHALGDTAAAWEDARQALELAREVGGVPGVAMAHQALGYLYLYQGDASAARASFAQVLEVRRPGSPPWVTMEPLAGLAAAEMALGELDQAQVHVAEILAFLDSGRGLLGDHKPFWIYLVCTQVLAAAGDPRAERSWPGRIRSSRLGRRTAPTKRRGARSWKMWPRAGR